MKTQSPTAYLNWLAGRKLLKPHYTALALELKGDTSMNGNPKYLFGVFIGRRSRKLPMGRRSFQLHLQLPNDRVCILNERLHIAQVCCITREKVRELQDRVVNAILNTGLLVEGHGLNGKPRRGRFSEPRSVHLVDHYDAAPIENCCALSAIALIPASLFND